jgi:hypothetical protein
MEGTTYMRIVFLSYMKLYHWKISCTTLMTAGIATTVLDGYNNTDLTMRCWRHVQQMTYVEGKTFKGNIKTKLQGLYEHTVQIL